MCGSCEKSNCYRIRCVGVLSCVVFLRIVMVAWYVYLPSKYYLWRTLLKDFREKALLNHCSSHLLLVVMWLQRSDDLQKQSPWMCHDNHRLLAVLLHRIRAHCSRRSKNEPSCLLDLCLLGVASFWCFFWDLCGHDFFMLSNLLNFSKALA